MFDKLIQLIQNFGKDLLPFFVVDMWEKALVLRFGKFHDIKEPGIHYKIPFVDSVWHQTVVTQSIHLHPQSITSLDYRNIVVRAIVRYDISDCYLFLTKLSHPTDVLVDTTGAMIREIIEERN
jgi:membrane protease subunit HflK